MNILITGGCGFVGSNLAKSFAKNNHKVTVFDNLKRKGSELNLSEFKNLNIEFIHGDLRQKYDIDSINKKFDLIIDAAAEPSVLSKESQYSIDTNLNGTINLLNFAINNSERMIFLSTSRVYSINKLRLISLIEEKTRFSIDSSFIADGIFNGGINEKFSTTDGYRSIYGTTKLASEFFIQEYSELFKYPVLINRCGVICGAGQFGKTDQGVFSMFLAKYILNDSIKFIGYNGSGKQVRDLIHPYDLFLLINKQIEHSQWNNDTYCVGGGIKNSTSLLEYSDLCKEITNNTISIVKENNTNQVDIPYYVTDISKVSEKFIWSPTISVKDIISDIYKWLINNPKTLQYIFN